MNVGFLGQVGVSCFIADVVDDLRHDDFGHIGFESMRGSVGVHQFTEREIKAANANPEIMKVVVNLVFLVSDVNTVESGAVSYTHLTLPTILLV